MFKSQAASQSSKSVSLPPPSVRITVGRPAYRPGEQVIASIDVHNERSISPHSSQPRTPNGGSQSSFVADLQHAVLIKDVTVEIRGVEKVDPTWIVTPKPPSGTGVRGERLILASEATSLSANLLLKPGGTKTWSIKATLPKVLPPSYRGTAVRYGYFIVVTVTYGPVVLAADEATGASQPKLTIPPVIEKTPFRVWSVRGASGLSEALEEGVELYEDGGIVPKSPVQIDIFSREKTARSNWIAATEALSGGEEEEGDPAPRKLETSASQPIEVPAKSPTLRATSLPVDRTPFPPGSPSMLGESSPGGLLGGVGAQSVPASRTQSNGTELADAPSTSGYAAPELERASSIDLRSLSSSGMLPEPGTLSRDDSDELVGSPPPSPLLSAIRGRTYNIRIGDQLLVRFSPRNPEPVYTLGDAVSGTLDFSHYKPGERRCLKVSVMLETQECVTPSVLHPSRRGPSGSQIIPKVQTEYHELSADLIHTHFIFTIPGDAPQSFTTPLVDVQWTLRFEFLASPTERTDDKKSTRGAQQDRIEKAEWVMPVLVHAPLSEKTPAGGKRRKPSAARTEREGGYQAVSPSGKSAVGSPKRLDFGEGSEPQDDETFESGRESHPS